MKRYIFTTKYQRQGLTFGGYVEASTWDEAQALCDRRTLGETVDGQLWSSTPADGITATDIQRFADMVNNPGKPPEAHEFD